ncbi:MULTISPECIES: AraC family transcriptional regulator [unclassified Nocardiopsis]|uniref:AraC family transcriptional regulator n=1 Tax=unclassified Nocardiopsis TaxID=2649073 RepID=UPI001F3C46DA|nr:MULTISPECIES: AraC family transcriptional regulator [unclassified Nocardiopsis]
MDPLSDMLGGIRSEGAVVSRTSLEAPWTLHFTGGAPLTMLTVVRGGGSVLLADGTALEIAAGDTALVRGPETFHLTDGADASRGPRRTGEIACLGTADPHGWEPDDRWESASEGSTALVVGAYRTTRGRHERLVRTLPPALVLREESDDVLWLNAARDTLSRWHLPGSQALIDRILDWGLVCTLGCWFDRRGDDAPTWYRGAMDPVTGPALEAIHERPGHTWTVSSLAARARVSRSLLAKRFTEVMGQPPLTYLTDWRMHTAEELLADPDLSVAQVAGSVGYADPAAFSTAFKRWRGMSPREFRSGRG